MSTHPDRFFRPSSELLILHAMASLITSGLTLAIRTEAFQPLRGSFDFWAPKSYLSRVCRLRNLPTMGDLRGLPAPKL